MAVKTARVGAAAFLLANIVSDILIETHVHLVAEKLTAPDWLLPGHTHRELRHTAR